MLEIIVGKYLIISYNSNGITGGYKEEKIV